MNTVRETVYRLVDDEGNLITTLAYEPVDEVIIKDNLVGYVAYDEYPLSPKEWATDEEFLVAYHKNFWVPHEEMTEEYLRDLLLGEEEDEEYFVFPIEAYIHSGVVLAFASCGQFPDRRWDVSNPVGAIFVSKSLGEKEAERRAEMLLREWNTYLSGDVYIAVVEEKEGGVLESVSSIYGYKYAVEEMEGLMAEVKA